MDGIPPYNYNTSNSFHAYWPNSSDNFEMNIVECGYEHCEPLHICGPVIKTRPHDGRKYHLIKIITAGRGRVIFDDRERTLSGGDGFYVPLGREITYISDEVDPWSYTWLGFVGIKAETFIAETTLPDDLFFHCDDGKLAEVLSDMYSISQFEIPKSRLECLMISRAYEFFSELIRLFPKQDNPHNDDDSEYVKRMVALLQKNCLSSYSIADLSRDIGFSRSYVYKLFDRYLKMPPAEYLKKYRLSRACELLRNSELSIEQIAFSCGYCDRYYFTRVFTAEIGIPPAEFRANAERGLSFEFNKIGTYW